MEEDLGVKAPVTRLRRRMSVEAEDSPLPTTPSTPTKKRTTRLAAKPQLELIDEIVTENVPKRTTRKAAIKETVETDTNTGTPTPLTPSRRSTRIRSNTSIISETTQSIESPRAKRALRRTSQLGSDTESAAVTPARQTRRTRKDSTTNVEKPAGTGDEDLVVPPTNDEVGTENPEKNTEDSKENETDNHSPSTRKSPRLQNKKGGKADVEIDKANNEIDKSHNNSINTNKSSKNSTPVKSNHIEINRNEGSQLEINENNNKISPKVNKTDDVELPRIDLLNDIKTRDKTNNALNKSTSAIEKIANDLKNKRNRTKSWSTKSSNPSNVGFISDNEESKDKINGSKTPNTSFSGSGDGLSNKNEKESVDEPDMKSPNRSMNTSKSSLLNTIEKESIVSNEKVLELESLKSDTVKLFENSPINQQPFVLIEDSDSCSVGRLSIDIQIEGEDQCVPVIANPTNESSNKHEQTVEPMDIDESMPVNVTIDDFSDKSNTSKENLEMPDKRKSSVSENDVSINKSKRKSSIQATSDTPKEEVNNVSINKTNKDLSISSKEKSNRSSSFSQVALEIDEKESRKSLDKSQRKSSFSIGEENNEKFNESSNKSKRMSSISLNSSVNQNTNDSKITLDKSQRKASISVGEQNDEELSEGSKKSKRKSSMSINEDNTEKLNESSNKSKRNSSVSLNSSVNQNTNDSRRNLDKSQRKASISVGEQNDEELSEGSKKSKRKSSMSIYEDNAEKLNGSSNKSKINNSTVNQKYIVDESNDTKSSNKSKRSSSVSQTDSQNLEKSGNENKSTLVISQLKDVSMNDINNALSPNVTNNELSKSMNGPDVKNKMDKKNISLNYLTSTPIQQKPLHKMTMQINTSIISPAVDNKNNTSEKLPKKNAPKESDSSDETDKEIKFKTKKDNVVAPKKKYARAPSSSESSDEESDTESKSPIKKAVKKSPTKKVPTLDSSDSDEDSEKDKKKTPSKKLNNLSKSDLKVEKSPNKIVPAFDSSDSDEESVKDNKKLNNQSKSDPKVEAKIVKPNKKSTNDSSDTSDDSDEELSKDRSKLVDDEASEASEDYESGDSQNEEDRRYEAENEIVDKGETLESDGEFSNDSDYEKDSFIVSSDAEDNDMLSGTGDDLTLSDNELTMSAKSKKKFNERKLKQQKKASREMYEARHKKDESADIGKSETSKSKSKRQRLESSTLESENENTQPKKSNRLRIDSSQDGSMVNSDADESIGIKKKKSKRLSESVHEITTNEKEISMFNQSTIEKNDPLSVAVKQEPKTPQKHFDMSTVAINDKIEEVQLDSNASIMRRNESLDPLQATIMVDDVDDSSSSDNMEIIQNYDSVLNNLTLQRKKIKTVDTSLNLNKKSKDSKDPMIDQLNLTLTKKSKKNKNKSVDTEPTEKFKSQAKEPKAIKDDEDFSDSIDMKLLFPEDSNDSEINASQFKTKINEESVEDFIPLKRTEAQTNIPGNMDSSVSELNVSKKKNKKRKSSFCVPVEITTNPDNTDETEDSGIKIIIDTKGTHKELELDTSIAQTNSSKKKKNKKDKSLNEDSVLEGAVDIDCIDGIAVTAPVEISFASEKKTKKNKNKSFDVSLNNAENSFTVTENRSEKKKKTECTSDIAETQNENTDNTIVDEMPVNISTKSDKKKKKNKIDVSQSIEPVVEATNSAKKKSKTSISVEDVEPEAQNAEPAEIPAETSINSEKKKRKKKKKNKQNLEDSQTIVDVTGEESDDAPVEMSYKSEKKSDTADSTVTDEVLTSSEKKKHKKNKKKKKNKDVSQSMEKSDDNVKAIDQSGDVSMKRKRKGSGNLPIETEDIAVIPLATSNEKKKRKVQLNDECIAAYDDTERNNGDEGSSKKSKKNKSKYHDNIEQDEVPQHNNKKRKNRDDDSEEKINKVFKQNSFDKIHVPKIPESVIKQLSENPQNKDSEKKQNKLSNKKNKKATTTAIATMPFVVEEAERRKNKPSNYLEQSIYLNDTPVKTKQKRSKDKPKVLPFIPTALTSDRGYTSKFNINVLPGDIQFVAQASNVENFKESFLGNQRIKKLGTLERCKMHRSHKISKF